MTAIKSTLGICIYCYLAAVIAVWGVIWFTGDKWWFGTVLMYGPRWIYAVPLVVLVPLALMWRRPLAVALGLAALIIAWPLMGLNVPLDFWGEREQTALRVMTYNVQRWEVTGEEFTALLDEPVPTWRRFRSCLAATAGNCRQNGLWPGPDTAGRVALSHCPHGNIQARRRGEWHVLRDRYAGRAARLRLRGSAHAAPGADNNLDREKIFEPGTDRTKPRK